MEELSELVRKIPTGRCASYGALGAILSRPVSGLIIGRWMNHMPADVPWWRVVGRDGGLPIQKQSPHLGAEQREKLIVEGVQFEGEVVIASYLLNEAELAALAG